MTKTLNRALTRVKDARSILANPAGILPQVRGQPGLNSRERVAIDLAVAGKTLEEVAEQMNISRNTAGSYYKGIARKTGISKSDLAPFVVSALRKVIGQRG